MYELTKVKLPKDFLQPNQNIKEGWKFLGTGNSKFNRKLEAILQQKYIKKFKFNQNQNIIKLINQNYSQLIFHTILETYLKDGGVNFLVLEILHHLKFNGPVIKMQNCKKIQIKIGLSEICKSKILIFQRIH